MDKEIIKNMNRFDENSSPYACKNIEAYRLKNENDDDIRTPFFRDIDRIIYSLSYNRYQDKTQVFSFNENDNISKRMIHVQLVSKIARTIGRALNLNEDLIEAASLGHDLGHVPFGHAGEYILNDISLKVKEGYFNHNIQSVRNLMFLENNGIGRNLTVQVIDAIMCHNGELVLGEYSPVEKTKEEFLLEYENSYKDKSIVKNLRPMTLEGCVVRISDFIAYVGRDIEDAIRLNIIKKEDIPQNIRDILGDSNKEIVGNVVADVIKNSFNKPYIKMSDDIYNAVQALKKFNYDKIYAKANTRKDIEFYTLIFNTVFDSCLNDIKNKNINSDIFLVYLNEMSEDYKNNTTDERKVIDYIAGMTDDFITKQYQKIIN